MEKFLYDGDALDVRSYASYKFLTVASCGVHVNANHITQRRAGRPDYHLLYVESGEMVCEIEGKTETLSPGGYVLYLPNEQQKYEQNGGVCYWVHFSGTAVGELIADAGLKKHRLFPGQKAHKGIIDAFERMIFRYITDGHSNDLALSAELLALFSCFRQRTAQQDNPASYERLCSVVSYLNKHYFEPLDIGQCAGMLCLSSGRFAHLFKETTGMSPYAYILQLRMEKASELLALTDIPVAEISQRVGFDDPLYFSRMFRKRYGVCPKVFRKETSRNAPRRVRNSGCE